MADNIFLDANVFMYTVGAPHADKEPCVRILSDLESGVLKEFDCLDFVTRLDPLAYPSTL